MDRIMPGDLKNAKLKLSFRGYAREEVQNLLGSAASTIEGLLADLQLARSENEQLRRTVEAQTVEMHGLSNQTLALQADVERLRQEEQVIRDTLVIAQKAADETRVSANKQAEEMLEDARKQAQAERTAMQTKINDLRFDLDRIRKDRQSFIDEYRSLLERQRRELDRLTTFTVIEGDSAAQA